MIQQLAEDLGAPPPRPPGSCTALFAGQRAEWEPGLWPAGLRCPVELMTGGLGELGRVDGWYETGGIAERLQVVSVSPGPAARPLGIWQASAAVAVFDADPPDAGKSPVSA